MGRVDNAVLEAPFYGSGVLATMLTKQVSRGTVFLNTDDIYADPLLDYRTFTNPVDVDIMVESYRFVRRWHESPTMKRTFAPLETKPGADVGSDAAMTEAARNSTSSSAAHISGTCSMMPRNLGGVVGTDLLVYGVDGLSVADLSVSPLIPGAHTCSTVYAIAEKVSAVCLGLVSFSLLIGQAADIVKERHKEAQFRAVSLDEDVST